MNYRQLFLRHIAQTSPEPIGLEIVRASGCNMWDTDGKQYLDLISGFSVMNMGHGQPAVIDAINKQASSYMHLMVYGELIESPQVAYGKKIVDHLPATLDCVYFTNSGTEATEGALKLAKRITNRTKIIACNNSYHGSTHGALSIMGDEYFRNAFRPLLPGVKHVMFNSQEAIDAIDDDTACIIFETVQAEAGVIKPALEWIKAVRKKCDETGTMLILDEIQAGFGRTGTLWAFEQYGITPDILLLGKALGGGMPLGAFIASHQHMQAFTNNPVLGHISTFAGHPVSCASGLASFELLLQHFEHEIHSSESSSGLYEAVKLKEKILIDNLQHPAIKAIRSAGLLMAIQFASAELCLDICHACIKKGVITDWFLFAPNCMRIAPPLVISSEEIMESCVKILAAIDECVSQ